jgi:hypothetical protein
VIYSMTTSTHADTPRGMNFLYSLNRYLAPSSVKHLGVFAGRCSSLSAGRLTRCGWRMRFAGIWRWRRSCEGIRSVLDMG